MCWNDHDSWREDGHILRRACDFEVEDQRNKGRPRRTWKKQDEEESMMVGLRREDALRRTKWFVALIGLPLG